MTEPNTFSHPEYIAQVLFNVEHAPDDKLRYRVQEVEAAFAPLISSECKFTNAGADQPPDVPRLTLSDSRKTINLAPSRTQFLMTFESSFGIDKAFSIAEKNLHIFFGAIEKLQSLSPLRELSMIVQCNQPSESSSSELATCLTEHLYKGPLLGDLASLDLRLGFSTEADLYKNIALSVYELKKLDISTANKPQGFVYIDPRSLPTSEIGICTALDVNNRLRLMKKTNANATASQSLMEILEVMTQLLKVDRHPFVPFSSMSGEVKK